MDMRCKRKEAARDDQVDVSNEMKTTGTKATPKVMSVRSQQNFCRYLEV